VWQPAQPFGLEQRFSVLAGCGFKARGQLTSRGQVAQVDQYVRQVLTGNLGPGNFLLREGLSHVGRVVPHRLGQQDRMAQRLPTDDGFGILHLRSP
jgi:hypothetical protein